MNIIAPDPTDTPENDDIQRGIFALRVVGWGGGVLFGVFIFFAISKIFGAR